MLMVVIIIMMINQTKNFDERIKLFTHKPKYIHIGNSASTVKYSDRKDQYNMTRLGISLYGCYPSENIEKIRQN